MTGVSLKATQYGLSRRAGGWDPDGDSGTDDFNGNVGNKLTTASCALTVSAEQALADALDPDHPARLRDVNQQVIPHRLRPFTILRVTWNQRQVQLRSFDDRAPEAAPRIDLFNPWQFDSRLTQDTASVSVMG